MTLTDLESRTEAGLASTGEQKTLLIGLILSHARLIAEARGFAPLLLLDDRRCIWTRIGASGLFRALRDSPAQIIMTGTDAETFLPLADQARPGARKAGTCVGSRGFLTPSALSSDGDTC